MYILGINAAFHSAACLLKDGRLIAAAEDERFTHIKHGKRPVPFSTYELPFHAIDYCLRTAGIHLNEVDHIAYSFDPYQLLGDKYQDNDYIRLPLRPTQDQEGEEWLSPWDPLFLSALLNAREQLRDGYPHHLQKSFRAAIVGPEKWQYVKLDKAGLIPAVRHVYGTARIQTINRSQHARYYDLLKAFKEITGVPVLVNTSFNTLGKPIVCSPRDAIECFWSSPFDALVIGSFLLEKQPAARFMEVRPKESVLKDQLQTN
jgi:predicted NodU family carbamoyl transferase